MAGSKTNFLENELLDHATGVGAYTAPGTLYLALFTSDPTDTGAAGTEVSGGSYARETIAFDAASSGSTDNSGTVTFTQATAGWGTISHFGIMDAVTSGNMMWHGDFDTAKAITTGDTLSVPAGDITITED